MSARAVQTAQETAVIDRWDAGDSIERIADALGVNRHKVSKIVSRLHVAGDGDDGFEAMVRRGDAAYQAALAASGGWYR